MSDIRTIKTYNSVYELDEANKRVRRVSGVNPPTRHFAEDGRWHELHSWAVGYGNRFVFWWGDGRYTITSTLEEE